MVTLSKQVSTGAGNEAVLLSVDIYEYENGEKNCATTLSLCCHGSHSTKIEMDLTLENIIKTATSLLEERDNYLKNQS